MLMDHFLDFQPHIRPRSHQNHGGSDKSVSTIPRNFLCSDLFAIGTLSTGLRSRRKRMNSACGILISISMVLVTVSSTSIIIDETPGAVCNKSVNRTEIREVPDVVTYERRIWWTLFIATETVTETIYKLEAHKVSVVERTCCEGYKNQSGVCKPQCSPECKNAKCTQPNVCTCDYGWKGDSCNEPLLCVTRSSFTDEPQIKDVEVHECQDQSGRRAVNITDREHVNIVSCLLPLNCLEISAGESHSAYWKKYVIFVVVGILLFSMTIYTVYTVQRKLKAKKERYDVQKRSDIPLNYMVDNTIYG